MIFNLPTPPYVEIPLHFLPHVYTIVVMDNCCSLRDLTVRFANTDGDILTDADDAGRNDLSTRGDLELGACVITERGLIVVDRTPRDEVTRLWVRDIVALVKFVLHTELYAIRDGAVECECSGVKRITVFLPRTSVNMFEEAENQRLFYSIGTDVTLVPV